MFGRKSNIKAEGFLVCVCASEEALSFFEAFQKLLFFLIALLFAIIDFHFHSSDISPLETHYAIFLLFLVAIFVYGLAYVLIAVQPRDSEYLSKLRLMCLVFGTLAMELPALIIISPFWLFIVNLCSILIIGVLCSYKQISQFVVRYVAGSYRDSNQQLFKHFFQGNEETITIGLQKLFKWSSSFFYFLFL